MKYIAPKRLGIIAAGSVLFFLLGALLHDLVGINFLRRGLELADFISTGTAQATGYSPC